MTELELLAKELLKPSKALLADMKAIEGDVIILGAGGKMGPALALLAKEAADLARSNQKIMAASRFSEEGLRGQLEAAGIKTYVADLLEDDQLQALPDVKNVLYLAGTKFGTTGKESFTWAMNSYLPGRVAEKYKNSRIVVFSTGNVYPLTAVAKGGATENDQPGPIGEYAQSCLGRERVFQYHSSKYNTPIAIYRLNYANDVSYGVLLEIAKSVNESRPLDLSMGHVNVIWQGDANEIAIRSLLHCKVPAEVLNVTGAETISVRWLAEQFGQIFNKKPNFVNEEQPTALLSNSAKMMKIFGEPNVSLKQMIDLIGQWVIQGGATKNKPSHFQERKGQF